jgi:hypothetical protein
MTNIDVGLREKILKVQALAERGDDGEKVAAARMLDRLLSINGLTLDDLQEQVEMGLVAFSYRTKYEKRLLLQIKGAVTGRWGGTYYQYRGKRIIEFELSEEEASRIREMFDLYAAAFKDEVEILFSAFVQKHDLGRPANGEEGQLDLAVLRRLLSMMQTLPDIEVPARAVGRLTGCDIMEVGLAT